MVKFPTGKVEYPIFRGLNTIGRDKSCTICLNNPTVSSRHAAIEVSKGMCWISDSGSTNKVKLIVINNSGSKKVEVLQPKIKVLLYFNYYFQSLSHYSSVSTQTSRPIYFGNCGVSIFYHGRFKFTEER